MGIKPTLPYSERRPVPSSKSKIVIGMVSSEVVSTCSIVFKNLQCVLNGERTGDHGCI